MRILNVSTLKYNDAHTYYGGAIGNIAYNLLAALADREGTTVDSFTTGTELRQGPVDGLRFHEVTGYREISRHLDQLLEAADVVTHLYFHEPEYNPLSRRLTDHEVPFVIGMGEAPHPRLRDEVSGLEAIPLVRRVGKRLLMPRCKRTLSRADRIVVVDEQARDHYGSYYPEEDLRVIPYGVDLNRFTPSPLPDEFRVLMVTRLIERRGIDHLIDALPAVVDRVPETEVDIVGDGPKREVLARRAEDRGVRDRVTFHGNVDAAELVERYASCSVFAHLSYADGWNQTALEAMASGRPVICTDEPHNSMVVDGETGYKLSLDDPTALADRLAALGEQPGKVERLGARARERAEQHYAWDAIASSYVSVFESVIGA